MNNDNYELVNVGVSKNSNSFNVTTNGGALFSIKSKYDLHLQWKPKPNITTFELAQSIPYIFMGEVESSSIDQNEKFWRNFNITPR